MATLSKEQKLAGQMFDAYAALLALGWKEPQFAPKDGYEVLIIEAGSSGLHRAIRNGNGDWYLFANYESYSCTPILWRPK